MRKAHRGNNHGLQMLEDFVDSFAENELGVKYPLSPAMANGTRNPDIVQPKNKHEHTFCVPF